LQRSVHDEREREGQPGGHDGEDETAPAPLKVAKCDEPHDDMIGHRPDVENRVPPPRLV